MTNAYGDSYTIVSVRPYRNIVCMVPHQELQEKEGKESSSFKTQHLYFYGGDRRHSGALCLACLLFLSPFSLGCGFVIVR